MFSFFFSSVFSLSVVGFCLEAGVGGGVVVLSLSFVKLCPCVCVGVWGGGGGGGSLRFLSDAKLFCSHTINDLF